MDSMISEIWRFIGNPIFVSGGVLGSLLTLLGSHRLAKSRSREEFQRKVEHEQSEKETVILGLLGLLANDLLGCWEESTVYTVKLQFGPQDQPIGELGKIKLKDYEKLKADLVKHSVFPAKIWHELDQLPNAIEELNKSIEVVYRKRAFIECFHFSEMCKTLWILVVAEYVRRGGNEKELTIPMPLQLHQPA